MERIAIGIQDFETIRSEGTFYIDKTAFIQEWWDKKDSVTLITRPRRFGKTLTMDMVEKFFSVRYAGRSDLFEGLRIWDCEEYRKLQGTYPVIFLSFANIKEPTWEGARRRIFQIIEEIYSGHRFLLDSDVLSSEERKSFERISWNMTEQEATLAIHRLCGYLQRYYGKKVIVLLDEYDTPMQEAYVDGYWEEFTAFIRSLFNATFKTNPCLERAIMTGITRVSRESVFSDLNNLKVVTTTSEEYERCFGFTEEEVFAALDVCGYSDRKQEVKAWYDGFTFGKIRDIYNPWSVINYLDTGKFDTYWANTSSNSLIGKMLRCGSGGVKQDFEALMRGETLEKEIDEQIVYDQLDHDENALWSLLLAGGYLKVKRYRSGMNEVGEWEERYELELTNFEVKTMFRRMIRGWFGKAASSYNGFVKALLAGNVEEMNAYMNRIALETFSYFDVGGGASPAEPERFYHGFVLGLFVELNSRYQILSNRESGFGRYDVILEPRNLSDDAMILEFKALNPQTERDLEETAMSALRQIEDKKYETALTAKGISQPQIHKYGFAFQGKQVLIKSH